MADRGPGSPHRVHRARAQILEPTLGFAFAVRAIFVARVGDVADRLHDWLSSEQVFVERILKRAGASQAYRDQYLEDAKAGDYDQLLATSMLYLTDGS